MDRVIKTICLIIIIMIVALSCQPLDEGGADSLKKTYTGDGGIITDAVILGKAATSDFTINIPDGDDVDSIDKVGIIGFEHTAACDIALDLIAPDDKSVNMLDFGLGGDASPDFNGDYYFANDGDDIENEVEGGVVKEGEYSVDDRFNDFDDAEKNGTWILRILDLNNGDTGSIDEWELTVRLKE